MAPLNEAVVEGHPIIAAEDVRVMFANVKTILSVNAELIQLLHVNLGKASTGLPLSDAIADSFLKLMPFFRTYTEVSVGFAVVARVGATVYLPHRRVGVPQYCNNYWSAMKKFQEISVSNSAFSGFLRVCIAMCVYVVMCML
jgi:hypothetical protein